MLEIFLSTTMLSACLIPFPSLLKADREIRKVVPVITDTIYACDTDMAFEKLDYTQLPGKNANVRTVWQTGTNRAKAADKTEVHVLWMSPELFDIVCDSLKHSLQPVKTGNRIHAFANKKVSGLTDADGQLTVQVSVFAMKESVDLRIPVDAWQTKEASLISLIQGTGSFRYLHQLVNYFDVLGDLPEYYVVVRGDGEYARYLDNSCALIVPKDISAAQLKENLKAEYPNYSLFECYDELFRTTWKQQMNDPGYKFLLKTGLLVTLFLIVNLFGYLLMNRKRQQRVSAILIQNGMTKRRVRRINFWLSLLLSAPMIAAGLFGVKPLAELFLPSEQKLAFSSDLLVGILLIYSLLIIAVNLVIARQQRNVSIYSLYREG